MSTQPIPRHRSRRRRAARSLAVLGLVVGACTAALSSPAGAASTPQLERVLSYSNVQNERDDELRFDFIIRVPEGELPTLVRYSGAMNGVLNVTAAQRTGPGVDEEYQIVSVTPDGEDDLVAITLRGNVEVAAPTCESQPTTLDNHIAVTVPSGIIDISGYPVSWYANADCPGKQRPNLATPYNNVWGSPDGNSQDGWGAIVTGGTLAADKVIIDAENHNITHPADCGITNRVDFQWYRESGPGVFVPEGSMQTRFPIPHVNDPGLGLALPAQSFSQPGYYKLLAWPRAQSSAGGADCSTRTFTPGDTEDAFTVATVFNDMAPTAGTPVAHPAAWGSAAALLMAGGLATLRRRRTRGEGLALSQG